MNVFTNSALAGASGQAAGGGDEIERSLRFNPSDSPYLSKQYTTSGNRRKATISMWLKRGNLASNGGLFLVSDAATSTFSYDFDTDDTIRLYFNNGTADLNTSAVFRDPSAWYHLTLVIDTENATSSDRIKIYVNGVNQTLTGTIPSQNSDTELGLTGSWVHTIGRHMSSGEQLDGYLADVHFIDGQALAPTDFGEYDSNSVWQPIEFAGTYGTNGFHLDFSDNSSNAALGTDTSGNGNTWTVNNLSVAAGAGNDALRDSPSQIADQTDTGVGGEVVGNYAVFNPLRDDRSGYYEAPTNGNLETDPRGDFVSTIPVKSGKYYWEITIDTQGAPGQSYIGVVDQDQISASGSRGWSTSQIAAIRNTGAFYGDGSTGTAVTFAAGDILGFALDADNNKLWISKNGTYVNSGNPAGGTGHAFSGMSFSAYLFIVSDGSTGNKYTLNAGQRAYNTTAPTGFKAWCTANLPDPTIADGSTAFDTKLFTGNASTQSITGLNFSPSLVWTKSRSLSYSHRLYDTVRGINNWLASNLTNAATAEAETLTSFDANGFTLGQYDNGNYSNGDTAVAWTWNGGASNTTIAAGSISSGVPSIASTVRANPSAGFSIVSWTGTGSAATIGHGLNAAPSMLIQKFRSATSSWGVFHKSLSSGTRLTLDTTNAASSSGGSYVNVGSSTFDVHSGNNDSGVGMIAYCFSPVEGYSAFGSYVGNGSSTDGPFVYTGMRPAFILIKNISAASNWIILDNARDPVNAALDRLSPNLSNAEDTTSTLDITSTGFKIRRNGTTENISGNTYIYAAFASHPFKTSRAR